MAEPATLVSSDGVRFRIDEEIAGMIKLVDSNLNDSIFTDGGQILLREIRSDVLERVVAWCQKHKSVFDELQKVPDWIKFNIPEEELVTINEYERDGVLFGVLNAASFFDIVPLRELCAKYVAQVMKSRTPEEIRARWNLPFDFIPPAAVGDAGAAKPSPEDGSGDRA